MSSQDGTVSIRFRKFLKNPLLMRRQCCVDVIHPNRASISRKDLKLRIAQIFKVSDPNAIVTFGFKTAFGGGRSTGFACIYDDVNALKRYEKRYRLVREGLAETTKKSRREAKELKNRKKKVRGTAKAKCGGQKKK